MSSRAGCFKFGCLGCLVLIFGGAALIGTVGYFASTVEHQVERQQFNRSVPTRPADDELAVIPAPEGLLGEDSPPASIDIPTASPTATSARPAPGRIELDLSLGELSVRPGEPGSSIQVIADYDIATFELSESWTEEADGSWVYDVDFRPKNGFLGLMIGGNAEDNPAQIEIVIPPDVPVDLVGIFGLGETRAELGGLSLRDVHLELGAGDHRISFSQPTAEPMASLHLEKGVGELDLRTLGNASPREVWFSQSIGELSIDLSGAWQQDTLIEADLNIGEIVVTAPDGARLELERASVSLGEKRIDLPRESDLPPDAPTLSLELKTRIGEIRVN